MPHFPRTTEFDSTLALLREGYRFIPSRCEALGAPGFEARMMLRHVICVSGADAARMFYTPERFTRRGAIPPLTLTLLQDIGSVQTLDGAAHHRRKAMFMAMMTREAIARYDACMTDAWHRSMHRWQGAGRIVLAREVPRVLCEAACEWTGVPRARCDFDSLTHELTAMFDSSGSVGPKNWRAQLLRARTERWARRIFDDVRSGTLAVDAQSPVAIIASHLDADGALLPAKVAANELINLLRPTVAIERFIVYAALALYRWPAHRAAVATNADAALQFVQEVRRYFPFFPAVGGRALTPFEWQGRAFAPGEWVLLDLYGTNRDPHAWERPDDFDPARFRNWRDDGFALVPQGGGVFDTGHRCAGEWATIALLRRAAQILAGEMEYAVPEQDLSIDLSRMPAIPASGFVMERVRRTP
ncbi:MULTISPECIES: cytochrome P450 [unclassified Caballeronia]|uniref:cytochrome P450 n=1 Tax=unclassified Caballeronia TaxID=2646786 RepID=UPI0028560CA2|nr:MULTISPECIES: cytochrome P450 [unclassified Caballeronia]MDR5741463.1 cytochrome P450 [Caballeronia sp. LZ016]MDR5806776.1 cytochrome P450 [Caballeronia sp. LZ019]